MSNHLRKSAYPRTKMPQRTESSSSGHPKSPYGFHPYGLYPIRKRSQLCLVEPEDLNSRDALDLAFSGGCQRSPICCQNRKAQNRVGETELKNEKCASSAKSCLSPKLLPSPPNVERFLWDAEIPRLLPSVAGCLALHSRQESTSAIHDKEAGSWRNPPNKSTQGRIWFGVVGNKFGIGVLWRTLQAPDSTKEPQKNSENCKQFRSDGFCKGQLLIAWLFTCTGYDVF